MTEIGRKALEFVNEICHEWGVSSATDDEVDGSACFTALCRAIEQHEAFRQEVSDALERRGFYIDDRDLGRFIITKPDPLVEAIAECDDGSWETKAEYAGKLRAALAKRGGRIVFDD